MAQKNAPGIVSYYHYSQWLYELLIYNHNTLSMHYGFWKPGTKNIDEAMLNENQEIVETAKITAKDLVLDAGCGVGGTAIYVAKHTGAHVVGITITPDQLPMAQNYARNAGISSSTEFFVMDYTKTTFPDHHFDVIYGLESICYASPKSEFLLEAYRILKPGGRLVIADGYLPHEPKTQVERQFAAVVKYAFAMTEFCALTDMNRQIKEVGFIDLRVEDRTKQVLPSAEHFGRLERFLSPIIALASLVPNRYLQAMKRNAVAARAGVIAAREGLVVYAVHSARKPKLLA
jgi:tocopherol O-methyltransferase